MPIYDGLGIVQEKHSIIIEIGHAYTKCGFAREYSPRWIIPSEVEHPHTKKRERLWDHVQDPSTLYLLLREFLHQLYFRYLVVNPKDRRVVVVESVLCPLTFRNTLADVFFKHFEAPSLLMVPGHLMVLLTLGISSALVLDIGYQEALALPVCHGVTILKAWEALPVGGKAIHEKLAQELKDKEGNSLDEKILEDIKVRTCFVKPRDSQAIPPDVQYPLGGDHLLTIPGPLRVEAGEILFEADRDDRDLATVVLDCLANCPVDARRTLASSIVVVGGGAMLPGFHARLRQQLLVRSKPGSEFAFHSPPAHLNYVAWLGGSILGATDVVATRSLAKDDYHGHLPDWSIWSEDPRGDVLHNPIHSSQQVLTRQRTASYNAPVMGGSDPLKFQPLSQRDHTRK